MFTSRQYSCTRFFHSKLLSVAGIAASLAASSLAGAQTAEPAAPANDETPACAAAFEQAQRLFNETKYLAANQEILKCANPRCGDALSQECSRLYNELQSALPSVVFSAREAANGRDLFEVTVLVDGQPMVKKLDGKALSIDPGNHTFTFSAAGFAPVEAQAVIRSGEKFRQISAVLVGEAPSGSSPIAGSEPPPVPAVEPAPRKVPVASYVLGGLGVAGLGVGVALRVIGSNQYDQLKRDCAPDCPSSDIDKVKSKYTMSFVGFGVGAAALVGAVTVYLVQPREGTQGAALTVAPSNQGFAASLVGRF